MVQVREAVRSGRPQDAREFWRAEYLLDAMIASFPKPFVALMDGVVMGGGVGLACHARHRLVTARAAVAMPEVRIGLAPDVGGAYLLSRAPGELGTHLALTGRSAGALDAIECGLADRTVDRDAIEGLPEMLSGGDVDAVLGEVPAARPADLPEATLSESREWIDAAYANDSVESILVALRARPEEEGRLAAAEMETRSPTSLKVTLQALRRARELTLEECLEQDYRVSSALLEGDDLPEGIRAVLVDKDHEPRWRPANLAAVTEEMVDRHFAPAPDELRLIRGHPPPTR